MALAELFGGHAMRVRAERSNTAAQADARATGGLLQLSLLARAAGCERYTYEAECR